MRILQVNKLYAPVIGGIETVVQQLAQGLKDRAHIDVLVCNETRLTEYGQWNDVPVTRAGSIGNISSMPISIKFLSLFRKMSRNVDVVQLHVPFPLADMALLFSGYKGKVTVWWHSDVVRQKQLLAFYRPFMNWMLKRVDRIIVATQGHIDGSEYLGPYREKCVIIPYGIDDRRIEKGKQIFYSEEKSHNERTNFLFIGRFVHYKGCDILLKAFASMKNKTAILSFVGDGPLRKVLQKQVYELGIDSRVSFLGKLENNEIDECISKSDVLVLPSIERNEAFGIVQLEAMAYGKPVINTSLKSGAPYVSLDGITGLTVPPGDVQALSQAMDMLCDSEKLLRQYGENAIMRVEEYFRLSQTIDCVFDLYNELTEKQNRQEKA